MIHDSQCANSSGRISSSSCLGIGMYMDGGLDRGKILGYLEFVR